MDHSEFREDLEIVNPNTATSYDGSQEEGFRRPKPFWAYVGNGNLCTTVADLAKWVDNFRHHRIGGPKALQELTTRGILTSGDTINYARGIVVDDYRGLRRFQHGDSIGGYRASLMYFPDQATGILVLSNFSSAGASGKALAVADIYLKEHFPEPKAEGRSEPLLSKNSVEMAPSSFKAFEGTYFLECDGALLKLYRQNDRYMAGVEGTALEIIPSSDTSFFVPDSDMGLIGHEAFGKTYRYYPILKKSEYRRSFFREFMNDYFEGSPREVLSFFVKEEDMDPEELDKLLEKIKKQENDDD